MIIFLVVSKVAALGASPEFIQGGTNPWLSTPSTLFKFNRIRHGKSSYLRRVMTYQEYDMNAKKGSSQDVFIRHCEYTASIVRSEMRDMETMRLCEVVFDVCVQSGSSGAFSTAIAGA